MATVHGEFSSDEDASKAIEALKRAGVSAAHIRKWNIIPESPPAPEAPSSVGRKAVVGYLVGGLAGAAVGAALGAASGGPERSIPLPAGVRVTVDRPGETEETERILRESGAARVRTSA